MGDLQSSFLPLLRRSEIASFGIGCRQRVEAFCVLPGGKFAGFLGRDNGPRAVSQLPFRTRGQRPGQVVVSGQELRIMSDRLGVISQSFVMLTFARPGVAPVQIGGRRLGVVLHDMAVVGNRLVEVTTLLRYDAARGI